MPNRYLTTALLLLCLSPLSGMSAADLAQVSGYHGGEVTAKSGLTWLGLYRESKGWKLKDVRVTIKTVFDGINDEPGQKTGIQLSVNTKSKPLFLIRGVGGLTAGAVEACPIWKASDTELEPKPLLCNTTRKFKVGRDQTVLLVKGTRKEAGLVTGYSIELEKNGVRQTIVKEDSIELSCDESGPKLMWAGDLDRDGKLDLIVDTTNHYNMSRPTLFLSSMAPRGKLVKEVASLTSVGC